MAVVALPTRRLLERRRAQKLLLEGRRYIAALDPERAEQVLREALKAARRSGSVWVMSACGEELYQLLLRRKRIDEAVHGCLADPAAWP